MSITASIYTPYYWSPVYNDIIYQVLSDTFSNIDFKYVFDVNVNGTDIARYESRPRPDGTGFLNVSNLLQGYINNSVGWIEQLHTATGVSTHQIIKSDFITGYLSVRVGEAYRTSLSAPLTIYNGTNNVAGNPSFSLWAQIDGQVRRSGTSSVLFYSGYRDVDEFYDFIDNPNRTDYKYVMTYTQSNPGRGSFLSEIPGNFNQREIILQRGDKCSISFRNDLRQKFNIGESSALHQFRFQYFSATGVSLGTQSIFNVFSSTNTLALTAASASSIPNAFSASYTIGQIACGAGDLGIREFIAGTPSVSYYTLRLFGTNDDGGGGILPNAPISETITFRLQEQNGLDYSRWRFSWLNKLGGRDWYNFIKKNTEIFNQQRDIFTKQLSYSSGSTASFGGRVVNPYNASQIAPTIFGETTYNMYIDHKFQASTDWVDEATSVYLKSLFNSPHILAYPPEEIGNPDIPRLVVIETTSYEVMDFNRGKVFNYTIDFRFSQNIQPQH